MFSGFHVHHHRHYPPAQSSDAPAWAEGIIQRLARMEALMGKLEDDVTTMEQALTQIGQGVLTVKQNIADQAGEITNLKAALQASGVDPAVLARLDNLASGMQKAANDLGRVDNLNPTTPDQTAPVDQKPADQASADQTTQQQPQAASTDQPNPASAPASDPAARLDNLASDAKPQS